MRETLRFLSQSILRPRSVGALAPSSRHLARAMVAEIGALDSGAVILELGPGTGVFTRELAERYPRNRIVAVEFNRDFADRLRQRMPTVSVVEGCASRLRDHLAALGLAGSPVGAVISGLPLLSLPVDLGDRIWASIADILPPGRRYIQFTYSRRAWRRRHPPGFTAGRSRRIWANLPPAVILPFERAA